MITITLEQEGSTIANVTSMLAYLCWSFMGSCGGDSEAPLNKC